MANGQMRVGDQERDAAVSKLQSFHAEGRLTAEEFEERMATALTAKTAADLGALFADLPGGAGVGQYAPTPEMPYTQTPYGQPPAMPVYQPPASGYYGVVTPVPTRPAPSRPPLERPWYAQWWMIIPAIFVANWMGLGVIVPLMAIWVWVVFPSIARSRQGQAGQLGMSLGSGGSALGEADSFSGPRKLAYFERDQVMTLVSAGRKSEAIRLYRQLTGSSLKVAKNTVAAWSRGLPGA